ncbi:MAG TPA: sugar phosphate isomerase/epimerase [Planctomycetes bacterium]|nr:sugar phosphate isomerase/epimerase [Planctomycetota bacterium]
MKIALCNEMYEGASVEEAARRAGRYGYTGIEVAPFTLGSHPLEADASSLRAAVEAAGLAVVGLHWLLAKTEGLHGGHPDEGVRRRTLDYLAGLADLCCALGGNIMVFGSPAQRSTPKGETRADTVKRFTETLARLGEACTARGVFLCLEPLTPKETDVVNTAAEAVDIIEQIGNPHVRLHLDVKAMSSEEAPAAEIIRRNAKYLKHFHANDPNRLGPGMGDVDFAPIIAGIDAIGYDGWLSVEVFDFGPGPDEIARRSAEYLRKFA